MLSDHMGKVEDLLADRAALAAEVERLRAAVATLVGACRHASIEIRRAAAFPSSLYGLGSIADGLDTALAAAEPRPAGETEARCHDCGLEYGCDAWCDVVIPNPLWSRISPTRDEGGMLCFNCIARRLARLGLENVSCKITSGPLAMSEPMAEPRPAGGAAAAGDAKGG